jgi:hypothetical protein
MAPHSEDKTPAVGATHEPGISVAKARIQMPNFPGPPQFDDPHEEREYLKGRLAAAFRIFGYGIFTINNLGYEAKQE